MHCPQCQHQNHESAKFCEECGGQLINICSQCGQQASPTAKFCAECGTALSGKSKVKGQKSKVKNRTQPLTPSPQHPISYTPKHLAERILAERDAMEARGAMDGERKTITALFADLKGSTALIEDLDPEEARRLIDPALQLMMDAVHRYEGYVAQSLGDGIFALFGAPIAHEDHPHRALYAALLMQDQMHRYSETLRAKGHPPLLMRVGVNTGEVVVRSIHKDDLHTDYVPVGQSTNIAARLENLATPGTIVISAHSHKLVEGYFECKALGETPIKGVSEPLPLYEVTGVRPLRTKMQVAARRGLARFVGRQSEMEQLQKALESAKAGHGQIVGVMGEPGVGKSRLFHEFKMVAQRGCLVLETFSVSHGKAYPYLPLIDLLKNYFQLGLHDDERQRREKLTGRALTLDRGLEDTLPYLFFLLGVAEPTSPLQQMDPQVRRKRSLEAIKRLLMRESRNQPLIVIFEDLHWLDAETQAFLQLLSENVPTTRLLLLVNYRPEYQHTWSGKTFFSQVRLDPLGTEQAEEMLTFLLGDTSDSLLKKFILEKTEGNPFFMEEIVQTLREQGLLRGEVRDRMPPLTDLRVPATVQGVLAARIDRLPPEEKALLQTLAVLGKEFSLSLLKHVVDQPEDDLLRQLARLQASEFIYERPAFPDIEYTFKHALTQEVAYNSLLIERRKTVHERAAKAIEDLYRYKLDDRYSELAHHYSRGGDTQKAVDYLQLAGQQAVQHSAYEEGITHLRAALELLAALPDSPTRMRQELLLQISLGATLMTPMGYGALETKRAYTRAWELCQQVGEPAQIGPVLWALSLYYRMPGEHRLALEPEEQLLEIAERQQDPVLLLAGHTIFGSHLWWTGSLTAARTHLEQGMSSHDAQQKAVWMSYGVDVGMLCVTDLALVLWCCGYPDQALRKIQDALSLAPALAHPHSLVLARCWAAWLQQFSQRPEQILQEPTDAAITIAADQGLSFYSGILAAVHGWALAKQGSTDEGIAQIEQGIALYDANAAEHIVPYLLALLAETQDNAGKSQEATASLTRALALAEKNGEHFYDAELYRLKGKLTLQKEARDWRLETGPLSPQASSLKPLVSGEVLRETEGYFLKAIEIAQKQQAKSLELRATVSLARLWRSQGKTADARRMLADIYGWFTEGFETKDLQEARALLEELSH